MPDPTITRRAAKNRRREQEQGIVRVEVRVPKDRRDEITAIAAGMREKARASVPDTKEA